MFWQMIELGMGLPNEDHLLSSRGTGRNLTPNSPSLFTEKQKQWRRLSAFVKKKLNETPEPLDKWRTVADLSSSLSQWLS